MPDEDVLAFAVRNGKVVLTSNRRHFIRLHKLQPGHSGIIVCTVTKSLTFCSRFERIKKSDFY
ncbi:DUF5615 family PIN-like protein [Scytonema hofmannii]|uniref:DUF5615 family PIN-like protein n=1 Tax=Scytonema hofmannii TaxID=34078 RepID=UPI001314C7B0|nr:DUF5615 family PIN-like protein [Scytonema hofmannii]